MISNTLQSQINKALKEKDEIRLRTLRLLSASLHNAEIEKRDSLTSEEELKVVRKEAKKRLDAIEIYSQKGIEDKLDIEKKELAVLNEFLPPEMSHEEIEEIVDRKIDELGVTDLSKMGVVMASVMATVGAAASGSVVSEIVRNKLSK